MTLLQFLLFNDRYFNQHKMYVQAAHLMDVLSGTQEDLDLATVSAPPSLFPFFPFLCSFSYLPLCLLSFSPSFFFSLFHSLSLSLSHAHTHSYSLHLFLLPLSPFQMYRFTQLLLSSYIHRITFHSHISHLHFSHYLFSPITLTSYDSCVLSFHPILTPLFSLFHISYLTFHVSCCILCVI